MERRISLNGTSSSNQETRKSSYWWRQHLAALAANLITLGTGMGVAWTASAQAVLRGERPGSPLRLGVEEASWATALVPVGALVGALPSGLLADAIGRRRTLLLEAIPEVSGWLLILFTNDRVWMLYVGRFLIGLTIGSNAVCVSMYNEEIAEVRLRGTMGTYLELMGSIGMLISYILGFFLSYFWYTAASMVPAVLFVLIFIWMPESPVYLTIRGQHEDARRSLEWLRGRDCDIQQEFDDLCSTLKQRNSFHCSCTLPHLDRNTIKTISLALGIMLFTQANGRNAFLYYMTDVFREAGSNVAPEIASIIVGSVFVLATFLPTFTVDRLGRKPLLSFAYGVMGLCQLAMSVYSHMVSKGHDVDSWRWLPLAALIIFIVAVSSGPAPISWFMLAELVPVEHRRWGVPLAVMFGRVWVLILIKEFPLMITDLGQDITYGIFCFMCFLAIGFTLLFIPETTGKTRDEI